jgi:hypothetical protein
MRMRFFATLLLALLGGFMLIETQSFATGATAWIGFGCGIAALAIAVVTLVSGWMRGRPFDVVAGLVGVVGAWTIVETLVFSAGTALWLTFASGGAILVLSLIGLIAHELTTERVVHSLEVGSEQRAEGPEPVAA